MVPDVATESLRVLQWMLRLTTFTMSELASASGASYETVKRVVASEDAKTLTRGGTRGSASGRGRPHAVWVVADEGAIKARLERARIATDPSRSTMSPSNLVIEHLESAEDHALLALTAESLADSKSYAETSLRALARCTDFVSRPDESGGPSWVRKRESIVRAIARVLDPQANPGASAEPFAEALEALASFDYAPHDALHKQFLIGLGHHYVKTRLVPPRPQLEHLPTAIKLEEVLYQLADGGRLDLALLEEPAPVASALLECPETIANLLTPYVTNVAEWEAGDAERLIQFTTWLSRTLSSRFAYENALSVGLLKAISRLPRPDVALLAQSGLAQLGMATGSDFWRELIDNPKYVSPLRRTAFVGLAHSDIASAFAYLDDELRGGCTREDLTSLLAETLPKLAASGGVLLQEAYADFVASRPHDERVPLQLLPEEAGLEWSSVPSEERLTSQYLSRIMRWHELGQGQGQGQAENEATKELRRSLAADIVGAAERMFPLLGSSADAVVSEWLTKGIANTDGAALGVSALLRAGRADYIAKRVLEELPDVVDVPSELATWYLTVSPRPGLEDEQRVALAKALYDSLSRSDATVFAVEVARHSVDGAVELLGNPAGLEPDLVSAILEAAQGPLLGSDRFLESFAAEADFLPVESDRLLTI